MDKIQLPRDPQLAKQIVDNQWRHRELELQSGVLGKFFGSGRNVAVHIAGLIAILLLLSGFAYTFLSFDKSALAVAEYWNKILPTITTLVGFILGAAARGNGSH